MLDLFRLNLFESETFVKKPIETVAALSGKSKIFSDKLAINDKKNKITQKKYKEIKDGLNTALKYYEDLINN